MKIDVAKQVAFWRQSAAEDWEVGADLVKRGRTRHGLFFVHLALEKALKAHVTRATQTVPPKIHTLPWLAEQSGLHFSPAQMDQLGHLNQHNLAGRYPETLGPAPSRAVAQRELRNAKELFQWLTDQL